MGQLSGLQGEGVAKLLGGVSRLDSRVATWAFSSAAWGAGASVRRTLVHHFTVVLPRILTAS